jgi:hypothetical protein
VFDFVLRVGQVAAELGRLLGARFVPGSEAQEGEIGRSLTRAFQFHNARRYLERDSEVARLALLAGQLGEVEAARPDVLDAVRPRLRAGSLSDFHGARQEVTVAKQLIRAGFAFDHEAEGRPDFVVQGPAGEAGIECTSAHLPQPREGDLFYKVERAMRNKAEKPYADPSVALAISTTSIERREPFDRLELARVLASSRFGSVLLFVSLVNLDRDPAMFEVAYRRVDAPGITPELRGLLDALWPRGQHDVAKHFIPHAP